MKKRIRNCALMVCLLAMIPGLVMAQVKVRAVGVEKAPIVQSLPVSGSVVSPRSSQLTTQGSGLVVSVNVDTGDRVSQGDVLLELDSELMRLELDRLLARRDEAELALKDAARLADEGRRLIEDRNIPKSEMETRLATEASEEARLRQLRLQVAAQQLRVNQLSLTAPFDGVIGEKRTEVGEWLGAGDPAFRLVQLDPLRIQASVPERFFEDIKPGTPIAVTVESRPGEVMNTRVQRVVPVTDSTTRSFMIWMDLANTSQSLSPGMSADLRIELGSQEANPVFQVPADAIVRRSDGSAVIWLARSGIAEQLDVTTGRRSEDKVEVNAPGLQVDDQVITLGNETLSPGMDVQVVGPGE